MTKNIETPYFNDLARAQVMGASEIHYQRRANERLSVKFKVNTQMLDGYATLGDEDAICAKIKVDALKDTIKFPLLLDSGLFECVSNSFEDVRGHRAHIKLFPVDVSYKADLSTLGLAQRHISDIEKITSAGKGLIVLSGASDSSVDTLLYSICTRLIGEGLDVISFDDVGRSLPTLSPGRIKNYSNRLHSIRAFWRNLINAGSFKSRRAITLHRVSSKEQYEFAVEMSKKLPVVVTCYSSKIEGALGNLSMYQSGSTVDDLVGPISGMVSQASVPINCPNCSHNDVSSLDDDVQDRARLFLREYGDDIRFQNRAGCENCHGSGTGGVVTVFESLVMDDIVGEKIAKDGYSSLYDHVSLPLFMHASQHIKKGVCDPFNVEYQIGSLNEV